MKRLFVVCIAFILSISVNVEAKVLNQNEYESLGVRRAYIVGDYMFDLSKHNPSLWDFLRAAAFSTGTNTSIIEIVVAPNIDGKIERSYTSLENGEKLNFFPTIDIKYIYRSAIKPDNPNSEDKIIIN